MTTPSLSAVLLPCPVFLPGLVVEGLRDVPQRQSCRNVSMRHTAAL